MRPGFDTRHCDAALGCNIRESRRRATSAQASLLAVPASRSWLVNALRPVRCESSRTSAAFQPVAPGDGFEFDTDSVFDGNHGSRLEYESRVRRAELVNGQWIVALHEQVSTPFADAHNEQFN